MNTDFSKAPIQPFPHQIEDAVKMVERRKFLNTSAVGTGKTFTAAAAIMLASRQEGRKLRVLWITTKGLVSQASKDLQAFFPSWNIKSVRSGKDSSDGGDIVVITYALAAKRAAQLDLGFAVVVMDEAHHVKTPTSKRTRALILDRKTCVIKNASYVWLMTGTPVTRFNDDLWTQLLAIDALPNGPMYRRVAGFRSIFCEMQKQRVAGGRVVDVVAGSKNTPRLKVILDQCSVRRTLNEVVADMPPLTSRTFQVEAPGASVRMTAAMRRMDDVAFMRHLQQDEHHMTLRRELGEAKVSSCVEQILDMDNGPALVLHIHRSVGLELVEQLEAAGKSVAILNGDTQQKDRDVLVDAFNAGKLDYLVLQVQAGGVGLNLQKGGACQIFVVETDWSPANMTQAFGRLHRTGQKNHVQVDWLVAENEIEERIHDIVSSKALHQAILLDEEVA